MRCLCLQRYCSRLHCSADMRPPMVVGLETEAVQRINAYADVGAIVGGTVDGAACDRLADAGGGVTGHLGRCDACRSTDCAACHARQGYIVV